MGRTVERLAQTNGALVSLSESMARFVAAAFPWPDTNFCPAEDTVNDSEQTHHWRTADRHTCRAEAHGIWPPCQIAVRDGGAEPIDGTTADEATSSCRVAC